MLNMCGSMVMGLDAIPEGLLQDFAAADRECAAAGIYHFAFGIWQRPDPSAAGELAIAYGDTSHAQQVGRTA